MAGGAKRTNRGIGEYFFKSPKLSGMNDQQRNRTLFECIRDRFEKTALLRIRNEKIKNVINLIYLFKYLDTVFSLRALMHEFVRCRCGLFTERLNLKTHQPFD